jgi:C_GCAxxG_C_C family probable redox protein
MTNDAEALFDTGLFCAEAVLLAMARRLGVDSPLIPRIASGLCSGMARGGQTCGALSGAVLGMGLVGGRSTPDEVVGEAYGLTKPLVMRFEQRFGATTCPELLGCDLNTAEGQRKFRLEKLGHSHCRAFTGAAFDIAMEILDQGD